MLAAFDVHYHDDGRASSAAVLFRAYADAGAEAEYVISTRAVSGYVPGQFYKRELPCILALLDRLDEVPDEMIVDGYVMLGDRPGLGCHLFDVFHGSIPVIGVAKSPYRRPGAVEVIRGGAEGPCMLARRGSTTGRPRSGSGACTVRTASPRCSNALISSHERARPTTVERQALVAAFHNRHFCVSTRQRRFDTFRRAAGLEFLKR